MTLDDLRTRWPVQSIEAGGHSIEVVRTGGAGLPVIWLPGAQGTAEVFYKQLLAFGDRRPMVAVTYPALTDCSALADCVAALADVLAMPRFDVIGTSLGGYVAQWLAVRHADRVHRLVLGNTFCDPAQAQSPEKRAALERPAEMIKHEALARVEASPDGELKTAQRELMGRAQSAELLRSRMLAVQLASRVPPLGVADDRMLLIECDNDPLIPPPMRAALREAHPRARHVVITGGGHYPHIVRPQVYDAAVADFLDL